MVAIVAMYITVFGYRFKISTLLLLLFVLAHHYGGTSHPATEYHHRNGQISSWSCEEVIKADGQTRNEEKEISYVSKPALTAEQAHKTSLAHVAFCQVLPDMTYGAAGFHTPSTFT